jgi:hypothetical protein
MQLIQPPAVSTRKREQLLQIAEELMCTCRELYNKHEEVAKEYQRIMHELQKQTPSAERE